MTVGKGKHMVVVRRPKWSVRARILAAVLVLTVLTLAIVGVISYMMEKRQIDDRLNTNLQIATEQFSTLASEAYLSGDYSSMTELLKDSLGHTVPHENEGTVGFAGDRAAWTQPGGLEMVADTELMEHIQSRVIDSYDHGGEISTVTTEKSKYRYAILPLKLGELGPGAYVVAFDYAAELEELSETFKIFTLASVGCLAALAFFAWLIAGELLAPLRQLEETAKSISTSDLSARIDVDSNDDLARLASTFNSMLDRLEGAFASQMQLLDDAGHELRTPITIIRGHLELMDTTDVEDVTSVRDLAVEELDRMHRLADDLVLLAKAKRPDFVTVRPVDVGPLLDKIKELSRTIGEQQVVIESRVEAIAMVDEQRITQAVLQLVANAVKFSEPDTIIRIGARVGHRFEIWVSDDGVGIEEEDLAVIFERFGRINPDTEGTGLGLTIVSAIAAGHAGTVTVDSRAGHGSTFTISIPMEKESWPTSS